MAKKFTMMKEEEDDNSDHEELRRMVRALRKVVIEYRGDHLMDICRRELCALLKETKGV